MPALNLIGQRFGKLTVISQAPSSKRGKSMWICKCDCGKIKSKPVCCDSLKRGSTKSCGCLSAKTHSPNDVVHGMSNTRLYKVYIAMWQRCYYLKHKQYKNYGGRGITICDEWLNDFMSFYKWAVESGYDEYHDSKSCTIDRINSNGNYEPSNCRWASFKVQENNRRNNYMVTVNGISKTVTQWADEAGIRTQTIRYRLENGWDESKLFTKTRKYKKQTEGND